MKLIDIQNSITKTLHKNFDGFKIVLEQQKDVTAPTFFVNVRKLNVSNQLAYKEKLVNVTITYVNKEYNHVECNEISDLLEDVFGVTLQINDRYLVVDNLTFSEPDALVCNFTLNFNDIITQTEYEKMEELVYRG